MGSDGSDDQRSRQTAPAPRSTAAECSDLRKAGLPFDEPASADARTMLLLEVELARALLLDEREAELVDEAALDAALELAALALVARLDVELDAA